MMADSSNIASGTLGTVDWYIDSSGVLHLGAGTLPSQVQLGSSEGDWVSPWLDYASQITAVIFDGEVVLGKISMGLFSSLSEVTQYKNIHNMDTSNITYAGYFMKNNKKLTSIDLTSCDMSSIIDFGASFDNDSALTSALLPNLHNVTSIGSMFNGCTSLTKINETNWGAMPSLTQLSITFRGSALENLDLSNWTTKVTSLMGTFQNMVKLKSIDMSNMDLSNCTTMNRMFSNCQSLISIKGYTTWNTFKVSDMSYVFQTCKLLTSLDLSKWDTSSVTTMAYMFNNCGNLHTFTGKINTSKVTTFQNMFCQDTSLKYLDLSSFTVNDASVTADMLNGVRPYVLGLSSNVKLSPKYTDGNTTGFISSSLSTSDLNGYRYYKYTLGGNASNVPIEGQNIVRNSDFSKGFTGFVKNLGGNAKGIVDIQKDTDGTNMVHMQYSDNSTGVVGFYTFSHGYGNNNPTTTHEINKGDIYTAIARVKGKGDIAWFGYEDVKNYLWEHVDYPDWVWISRTAVSPSHNGSMGLTINQGELYVKNFAIFHGSTAYPYIKAPEDIYSMSPTNVAGGADLIHMYKEGSNSRLTSYWVRTGTTIAKDNKGNILSSTPNQIYDISSKPYPLYYTIPPVFKGYRLVGTQSGSKPVGMLDPNNMNVTYLYEPILDPSVNDLTKTTAVVNQGIRSVSYTKGNTKVTKSPDVANTLNLDDIIKDSGRTSPNE